MGFASSIKRIKPLMNEESKIKAIVKFCPSKFENHNPTKSFSCQQMFSSQRARLMLLSRRLKKKISGNYNAISIDRFSSRTKTQNDLWHFNNFFI